MIGWFPMIARKVGRTHTHTHTHTQYSKIKIFKNKTVCDEYLSKYSEILSNFENYDQCCSII